MASASDSSAGGEGRRQGSGAPGVVFFPDARRNRPMPPPLKLEIEDTGVLSRLSLWQAYALGGVMLLRWIWARLKERESGRSPTRDKNNGGAPTDPPQTREESS